jgi:competence protein ComGC
MVLFGLKEVLVILLVVIILFKVVPRLNSTKKKAVK